MVLTEAASFLRIAAADLDTARASSDPAIFREGAWGFWLQQAVEKALKAWLLHFGVVPPTTHDLSRLLLLLTNAGAKVETFAALEQLTDYAVQFRYEADPEPLGLDRPAWNEAVSELLAHVETQLLADEPTDQNVPCEPPSGLE